ncbi:membrane protein [Terrihabitans soli]|uniref:Membrane protein n=1 Tax=Terrihabitans soli TaxID=708113 RepID=A0A6S6QV01_9HYPH|nr:AsmA-like C-terminal region-containing protein [Terrihabitans soli]BCJ91395.1 membrane protein [Terrihabitans soli]
MNHTLTGLGLAIVLALATALIGPFFIDWGDHREAFERQASRILGVPVSVRGDVEARLLPSPRIRFGQVVAGDEWAASKFTADSFELDLALMPLLRGEYEVSRLNVVGADLKASLSADGEIALPLAAGMGHDDLDAIAIADLNIENSRITVADPAANRNFAIEEFALQGNASSLVGPLKLDAAGKIAGRPYNLHITTGRFDPAGLGQVSISVQSPESPSLNLDGTVLLSSKPQFDGKGSLVQTAAAEGQPAREPWKIAGEVKADIRRLEADKVEFEHGATGRELRLAGGLGIVFGPKASAEVRLKGRTVDIDRTLGRPKDAPPVSPIEALTTVADRFALTEDMAVPLRVFADIENLNLGGDLVQNVKLQAASAPGGWTIENLTLRAPGGAQLDASGALMARKDEPRFNGGLRIDAPNVGASLHWLEGLGNPRTPVALKSLKLEATLAARPGSYALEDIVAAIDGADVKGRLAFTGGQDRNRLEARIRAQKLDLDALDAARLFAFAGRTGNASGTDIELALSVGKLTYAKVDWSRVDADLTLASGALDIRRLSIADLGGAKIAATGRLSEKDGKPLGRLEARIDAGNLNGLVQVLRASALPPSLADAVGARASLLAPAALSAVFDSSGGGATAKISGTLGGTAIEFDAAGTKFALSGIVKARLNASAADGARLFGQLGLPAIAVESFGQATLEAMLDGDPAKGAEVDIKLAAAADTLSFKGRTEDKDGKELGGRLDLVLDDAGRYAVLFGRAPPASLPTLPVSIGGDVGYGEKGFDVTRLAGLIQGRALKGDLGYGKSGLRGSLEIASLSISELAGLALGPLALNEPDTAGWPTGAAGPGVLSGLEGRVAVRTDALEITPGITGTAAKFNLVLGRNEFAVQDAEARLTEGTLKSSFAIRRGGEDLSLAGRLAVEGVALNRFVWGGASTPAAKGTLDLNADMLGSGPNIASVVSGLTGSGSFTLKNAELSSLDAGAFERTLIATENLPTPPNPLDVGRRFGEELAMANLDVSEISSAFTIASGVVRIGNAAITAPLVTATASGTLDLAARQIAAELVMRPKVLSDIPDAEIPPADITLSGAWGAPVRSTETTAFANALAVRAVEREIKRVEQMEVERREREKKAAEEEARRLVEEQRLKVEQEEAARLKAIREATGDIPLGDLPPPVDTMPKGSKAEVPPRSGSTKSQSPLDFLRRPVVPEASSR